MPKEEILEKKVEANKESEIISISKDERSTPLTFRENIIKKIPLVMSFSKNN